MSTIPRMTIRTVSGRWIARRVRPTGRPSSIESYGVAVPDGRAAGVPVGVPPAPPLPLVPVAPDAPAGRAPPPVPGVEIATAWPSRSTFWPTETTWSPAATPSVISVLVASAMPSLTVFAVALPFATTKTRDVAPCCTIDAVGTRIAFGLVAAIIVGVVALVFTGEWRVLLIVVAAYAVIAGIQWAAVHRRMRGNRDPR